MSPWRPRPGSELIVDEIGHALLVHTAGDPATALTALTLALQPEPGRVAVVTTPSITARSDYLHLVGQIAHRVLRGDDAGVRLVPLGHAAALSAVEPQLRALSHDLDRDIVAPLGSLTVATDGTIAVAAPSYAGGGWATYPPGRPPHYEPAWFPAPAWAKDLPPETAGVTAYGAAATYAVPAGYWILPRGVTPGRAGTAASIPPDPTTATVFLGGFGELPLALDDVILSLAALPLPDTYRLALLPGALRTRGDTAYLRAYCDPPARIAAAVPVRSGGNTWGLAFIGPTGDLTGLPPHDAGRAGPRPGRGGAGNASPAGLGHRDPGGSQTAAGWSFVAESEPVGVVATPAGFVVEVTVEARLDPAGFRVHGRPVTPDQLAGLITAVCPPRCRTVVVVAHGTPPTGHTADALFGALASGLGRTVVAADAEVSISRTGLLHTSGLFHSWRGLPEPPGTGPHRRGPAPLGDTLPPLPAPVLPVPGRPVLTPRPAPARQVGAPPAAKPAVTAPAGPRWITEGTCDTPDRHRLRQLLDTRYETHARIVVRQLFRGEESPDARPTAATVSGLVAARAYCATERDALNNELRGTGPAGDGTAATLIAECAMYGLRQLPVVTGPVFATCPIPLPMTAYETGTELVEPAFVDVGPLPDREPGDGVDYHIWSRSARRLGSIAPDGRTTAIFTAGSRFLILGVDAGPERPRVMLLDLAVPAGPHDEPSDTGPRTEEIVEMLLHGRLPARREPGPGPGPLAFPIGLDGSGQPYRRRDHRRHAAEAPAVKLRRRALRGPVSAAAPTQVTGEPPSSRRVGRGPAGPVWTEQTEFGGVGVVSAAGVRAEVRVAAPARTRWLDPGTPEPGAVLPAVLGEDGQRRLFLDLATVPGVLTVTGALPLCRRYALGIARTMSGRGCRVTVVGDALDTAVPSHWHRRPDFPEIDAADAGSGIVIAEGLREGGFHRARSLARRTGGRFVAVVIGDVLRSPWSVNITGTAS
ncbi:hypothetical protein ACFFX1_14140 [Dactylosporangium sucinum]|uniref:Uncharacterized protein n=1 Tax=Dactylosporangium sucinum TaxID=1424081 RepID=A0A917U7M4_9ACTN|nr:hypothetical protein [Dactylosporangium sucinum]GGM63461.1 hypothetical protein GCM10007977_076330 [Dactylosporangium sucinum]